MTRHSSTLAALALLTLAPASTAAAQDACFARVGAPADRAQALVSLSDTVRLSAGCEYGLAAAGPYVGPGELAGREADFLEVHHRLVAAGQPSSGDPRVIYARRRGAGELQTLLLRYCAHYIIEEQLGFRVVPNAGSGGLRVERVRPGGCEATLLELRVVSGVREGLLQGVAPEHTLATGVNVVDLPQGDWSIYAARPGSTVGLRVGVFRTQRVVTPLQNHLRAVSSGQRGGPALLAARWEPDGPGMLLAPSDAALSRDLLWPELRTAADAGVLWLARRGEGERPVVLGVIGLEAGTPASVRLPDSAVRDTMRSIYGDPGEALVPTNDDWRAVFSDLAMCLTPSYHEAHPAPVGAMVPQGSACAWLDGLAVFAQLAGGVGDVPAEVCLRHAMQRVTIDGARQALPEEADCFRLPQPGTDEPEISRVAVAGDLVTVDGHGLCVLVDGAPLEPAEGTDGEYILQAGLLEVRQGGGPGCASPQALARLRMPVFDPVHEWHPVGLYSGASESEMACSAAEGLVCPWRAIPHDESDVYAYVEPRQELTFRLSTSAPVAAVLSPANGDGALTQDVPMLAGVTGSFGGARPPAVFGWASRDEACPEQTYDELRARPPLDPDALLADATFNVFLLAYRGAEETPTCLARARFRSRPSRVLLAETVGDFLGLELGLLGDTQAVVFANDPVAMGLMLPLAWFRMTPGIRFISLEIAANLVMGVAFPQGMVGAEPSRLGASLSWAISFGVPEYLPRILTVGGMLHGAADTSTIDDPILSFYVGLNLATLVDLAGGR